jgi:uncharacterized membrane protein YhaH (DUF805 family)
VQGYIPWFYLSLQGRAGRRPFWLYFFVPAVVLGVVLGAYATSQSREGLGSSPFVLPLVPLLLWAAIAVQVKRLHDIGLSGWWVVVAFVPIVNYVAVVVLGCWPGQRGDNRHGPDPLDPGAPAV